MPLDERAKRLRCAIDSRLAELLPIEGADRLGGAMRYAVLAPGKRLRPLMTLLASLDLGGRSQDVLDAACAVEMIHGASLIMDDLPMMDDAAERRGRSSTHRVFGEDVALLASVALLALAHETVARSQAADPASRCELVMILAQASGAEGLSRGQLFDLRGEAGGPRGISETHNLKTAVLFVAAADAAAVICRAQPEDRERLRRFASHFGHAFQLADDLDDGPSGTGQDLDRRTPLRAFGQAAMSDGLSHHLALALTCVKQGSPLAPLVHALRDRSAPARRAGLLQAAV